MRVGIYARVSTQDQQTLPMQLQKMKEYIEHRGWNLTIEVQEIGSGAKTRPKRKVFQSYRSYSKANMVKHKPSGFLN